jgi:hypothetical protein
MLFEISIFCVILFAMGYWTTLFIMGRREDVLHGEFVEPKPELAADAPLPASAPTSIFPPRPVIAPKPAPSAAKPAPPTPQPAVARAPEKPADTEALRSLLASLKQELKNAAQI